MTRVRNDLFDPRAGLDRGRPTVVEGVWYLVKRLFFLSALPWPSALRVWWLRRFGAQVGIGVIIKPRVNIHLPWKLSVGDYSWIGEEAFILNFERVTIGAHACISQRTFLCTGNHNYRDPAMSYRNKPISIGDGAWIGALSFVGPGVVVGDEAVATAGSMVLSDLPAGMVCSGNPCLPIKPRWTDGNIRMENQTTNLGQIWEKLSRPGYWQATVAGVEPAAEHRAVLLSIKADGIIDVGANRGQFSLACRFALPGVPIVAFEPISAEAATFQKVHGNRPDVRLIESALGEAKGAATLHLSKSAGSSSLLQIGKKQTELFENTFEVGTITVPVHRLDDFAECWHGRSQQLLKLDVQGYELNVLRGATETLKSCAYVYAECSEVSLYDGQALRTEVEDFLGRHGFKFQGRYNEQTDNGQLIQAHYLFARSR